MKRKKVIVTMGIIFTIIMAVSISYAFFYYGRVGEDILLTSGTADISFAEGTNYFNENVSFPKSDVLGKIEPNYFDFTVSGSKGEENVIYEIQLIKDNANTLNDKYIKVYLTNQNDEPLIEPILLSDLNLSYYNDERVVYSDYINTYGVTHQYRLRVWIDSSYTENVSEVVSFKVNLYAKNDENKE